MADLYAGSNCLNDKCTRKQCRTSGIIIVYLTLMVGVLLISIIVPIVFYGELGSHGRLLLLSQGQTRIVEGRESTFCSGLSMNITSNRTTVTLYRLSQFPRNSNFDINSYITENAIESCSAGRGYGEECTVSNDRSSTYVVTTSSGPPHENSVRIQFKCQLAEGSIAGIVIAILMVYTLFCAGLLVGVLCCAQCIDNNSK